MRGLSLIILFLLIALSFGQDSESSSLFSTVRPDVIIIVREHSTGAENVQVIVQAKNYPPKLLQSQIERIGKEVGSNVRGLRFEQNEMPTTAKISILSAFFATDGLIDRPAGIVRLQPLVRAFAGAPAPFTVQGIKIDFEGEKPNHKMLQNYPLKGIVQVEGRPSISPMGVEYQVKLISQDPAAIVIPDEYSPPANQTSPVEPSKGANPIVLVGLFLVAGVAVGALVYLALLRSGGSRRRI